MALKESYMWWHAYDGRIPTAGRAVALGYVILTYKGMDGGRSRHYRLYYVRCHEGKLFRAVVTLIHVSRRKVIVAC